MPNCVHCVHVQHIVLAGALKCTHGRYAAVKVVRLSDYEPVPENNKITFAKAVASVQLWLFALQYE